MSARLTSLGDRTVSNAGGMVVSRWPLTNGSAVEFRGNGKALQHGELGSGPDPTFTMFQAPDFFLSRGRLRAERRPTRSGSAWVPGLPRWNKRRTIPDEIGPDMGSV